eukprot:m.132469 g.132469  ORF g.132469 m.132469 type:complete len:123 (+) comp14647_c0_seq8:659-1027(+)
MLLVLFPNRLSYNKEIILCFPAILIEHCLFGVNKSNFSYLYHDNSIFYSYPPPMGDQNSCMAVQCLQFYKGDTFVYVGEGRGGSCASEGFFDVLERDWVCEKIIDLDPFEQCFERMFVMRRK